MVTIVTVIPIIVTMYRLPIVTTVNILVTKTTVIRYAALVSFPPHKFVHVPHCYYQL